MRRIRDKEQKFNNACAPAHQNKNEAQLRRITLNPYRSHRAITGVQVRVKGRTTQHTYRGRRLYK